MDRVIPAAARSVRVPGSEAESASQGGTRKKHLWQTATAAPKVQAERTGTPLAAALTAPVEAHTTATPGSPALPDASQPLVVGNDLISKRPEAAKQSNDAPFSSISPLVFASEAQVWAIPEKLAAPAQVLANDAKAWASSAHLSKTGSDIPVGNAQASASRASVLASDENRLPGDAKAAQLQIAFEQTSQSPDAALDGNLAFAVRISPVTAHQTLPSRLPGVDIRPQAANAIREQSWPDTTDWQHTHPGAAGEPAGDAPSTTSSAAGRDSAAIPMTVATKDPAAPPSSKQLIPDNAAPHPERPQATAKTGSSGSAGNGLPPTEPKGHNQYALARDQRSQNSNDFPISPMPATEQPGSGERAAGTPSGDPSRIERPGPEIGAGRPAATSRLQAAQERQAGYAEETAPNQPVQRPAAVPGPERESTKPVHPVASAEGARPAKNAVPAPTSANAEAGPTPRPSERKGPEKNTGSIESPSAACPVSLTTRNPIPVAGELWPESKPAADQEEIPEAPTGSAPANVTTPMLPSSPARQVSLRLEEGGQSVKVQLRQRGAAVEISVRSDNRQLTRELQTDLKELAGRLEDRGYRTLAWTPADSRHSSAASANGPTASEHRSFGSGREPDPQQQKHNQPQRRPAPRPAQWASEWDSTLSEGNGEDL